MSTQGTSNTTSKPVIVTSSSNANLAAANNAANANKRPLSSASTVQPISDDAKAINVALLADEIRSANADLQLEKEKKAKYIK